MNKNYFDNNVIMAVEIEYEYGGRQWCTVKGDELDDCCDRIIDCGDYISDIDFACHQTDEWCRKVLNLAHINWFKNFEWCKAQNLHTFDSVIDFIIDNGLA